ncbi:class I SAM-dependent methyltransferase [Tolypothrix sp. FACHB-123]|uniref:methyltransferase domain-containing protein n=1 Tax=Tolypothrix sp. FACHB-123 TaxID=2692868 RepID=UPI001682822B|nr:methyltransferase domain-containing protein [Tolypothrix sp. FACHB-123]MBD2354782.1 class I SAM-dependent methyltransferase [Tolypothrix sp. FACHB-123]
MLNAQLKTLSTMMYKQEVINFYNARTNYDNDVTRNRAVALFDYTTLFPGQQVLDVATGTGNIALEAAKKVGTRGSVIGIDIATELLKIAQQKIQAENLSNVQLIEVDAEAYQPESNEFDAIYCSFAIVLFPNIPKVLKNWYRFLKEGGFIAFTCSSEDSYLALSILEACAKHGVTLPNLHKPLGTPERIQQLLTQANFTQIEIHPRQLGTYLSLETAQSRWNGQFWLHTDNPLRELKSEKISQIKASYDDEIATLETEQGVWHEELIYYVVARKE